MTSKRKHVSLNLVQKLEILDKLKQGYSTKAIVTEYNIGRATVYDLKMKENKLRRYTSQKDNELGKRKSLRKSENDLLDAAVYKWFKHQNNKGLPLTGTMIKEKALMFNKRLGGSEKFAASEGWLTNWKKRHGVRLLKMTEKSVATNKNDDEEFKLRLDKIIKEEGLTPAQVYNAGYIDLFIKRLPSKTHAARLEREACEQQDEHVTLLTCCNADGNHKLPLMLIGKSQKPRCFKQSEMSTLPVEYYAQKETEMSSEVFSAWFHNSFVPRVEENLKKNNLSPQAILLTANNASNIDEPLQRDGIRAIFLPQDAIVQPMDQGILESVKRRYRYNILNSLLDKCENSSIEAMLKAWKSIKMRDVVFNIAEAWDNVEKITIIKCWKYLWPSRENDVSVSEELLFSNDLFVDMFHRLPGREDVDEESISRWFEENLEKIKEDTTDEEIIKSVREKNEETDEKKEGKRKGKIVGNVESISEPKKISHAAAAEAAETLLQYLKQTPRASRKSIALVTRLRDDACQRQTSL